MKSYINNIDADQFCQSIHLCSTSLLVTKVDQCSKCIDGFQSRKIAFSQGLVRLSSYFDDLCQRFADHKCQVFIKQVKESVEKSLAHFSSEKICHSIGFCFTTNNDHPMNFDEYEKHLETELEKNVCSHVGPFETLCKQVIRGNRGQTETTKINYNVVDLMKIGEETAKNFFNAAHLGKTTDHWIVP